jgi:hypothetical protein
MPRSPTSVLQDEALLQLVDLGGERLRVGGRTVEHLDGDGAAVGGAQQAVEVPPSILKSPQQNTTIPGDGGVEEGVYKGYGCRRYCVASVPYTANPQSE